MLADLAKAMGVATEYDDWRGGNVIVPASTIVAVLRALGIDASDDAAAALALAQEADRPWRRLLPPVVVCREGWTPWVPVHLPHGERAEVWVELEDGGRRDVRQVDHWVPPRVIDGREVGEATYELPGDLPLGWHALVASQGGTTASAPLVVTPARLQLPPALAGRRAFGLMTQLYSVRSRRSWGVGDLADLGELASWAARDLGADFVLVNPLHAAEPVPPMEPSPYLPTTRRFVNPMYIRVEDIPELGYVSAAERQLLEWHADDARALNTDDVIDRDASWQAKAAALRIVFQLPRSRRGASARSPRSSSGRGRAWSTSPPGARSREKHGLPWDEWPEELHDPRSAGRGRRRGRTSPRTCCSTSGCSGSSTSSSPPRSRTPRHAGMAIGVVHDLAVGVHPEGADAWGLADALARRVNVGAPPDPFNQMGQDWSQPPWRPDRLQELGYAPYRDMLRTVLRHAGGIRVDHVIGLFRLWWVPEGTTPRRRHLRALRPRGADRHPGAGGAPRRRPRRRRGPRRGRAVGARLPARARDPRHLDPVVREGRGGPAAAGGVLPRAVPGHGHHARPAADRGLPRRRAHRPARGARAC